MYHLYLYSYVNIAQKTQTRNKLKVFDWNLQLSSYRPIYLSAYISTSDIICNNSFALSYLDTSPDLHWHMLGLVKNSERACILMSWQMLLYVWVAIFYFVKSLLNLLKVGLGTRTVLDFEVLGCALLFFIFLFNVCAT